MCEYAAACDARALHIGCYSAWLSKVKGDGARMRFMSSSTKRYFTIDYDAQLFYYSHSEDRKKISNPIKFKEILSAEQLPRPSQANNKKADDFTFGFAVKTAGRTYELYTVNYLDAKHWVGALNAGRDIANGACSAAASDVKKHQREPSMSSASTTADGSDSGRSSDRDCYSFGGYTAGVAGPAPSRGPQPWQPPVAQPPICQSSGSSSAPPVAYSGSGYGPPRPAAATRNNPPVAASSPMAPAPAPASTPEEPADPFAALDALEELAGPAPEVAPQCNGAAPQQNIQGALLREARNMLTNKVSKPSAEAAEALRLQRLGGSGRFGTPRAYEGSAATPAAAAAPTSLFAPPPAAPAPAPATVAAPAPKAAAPPPAAKTATTYHNPSAESWDSDDDTDMPKKGLLANQASPQTVQLAHAPPAATPHRAVLAPAPAPVMQAAAVHKAPVDPTASGWDSDEEVVPAKSAAQAPLHHQVAAGAIQATEDSGWDSDEDNKQFKKATASRHVAQTRGSCGAPVHGSNSEAFVSAKTRPASSSSSAVKTEGDKLDDLIGEISTTTSTVGRSGSYSHGLVPGFQCMACDFQVLRIDNMVWGDSVDYMFFRNNYPNVQKLRPQLVKRRDCCAYCCQCSWKSAESAAPLADVAQGLRWKQIGF